MVAELEDTMASKYFPPITLLKDKYSTWREEMQIWELAMSLDKTVSWDRNKSPNSG